MRYKRKGEVGPAWPINAWRDSGMEQLKETDFVMMAMAFPTLRDAAGVAPWNPNRLDIWASEEADSPEAIAAAQFLLLRWNPGCEWECGGFDPHRAFAA